MKSRPKGMSYAKACDSGLIKASDMSEDEYGKLPEHEEPDGDENLEKGVDGGALAKSIQAFDRAFSAVPVGDRRTVLLSRASQGLATASEEAELSQLLGGRSGGLNKSLTQQVYEDTNDDGRRLLDAQDLFDTVLGTLGTQLQNLQKSVDQNAAGTGQQIHVLGDLMKSMAAHSLELEKRLLRVENTPMTPRGVVGSPGPDRRLAKSVLGGGDRGAEGAPLSKSLRLQGLQGLVDRARGANDAPAAQRVMGEIAKAEMNLPLAPDVEAAIRQQLGIN